MSTARPVPVPGPHNPVGATPALAPHSLRRTTSIDTLRTVGLFGPMQVDMRGRDVARGAGSEAVTVDAFAVGLEIAGKGEIRTVEVEAGEGEAALLVGANIRKGFRDTLGARLPAATARRSPLYSALEDLNGAFLVSAYAPLREGVPAMGRAEGAARAAAHEDICAGWARGEAVLELLREGENAVPMGPPAPPITEAPGQWHPMAPPPAGTVRRLRSIDVSTAGTSGAGVAVRAHFRDSYVGRDEEAVMHEYLVHARLDGAATAVEELVVEARVLPWAACPTAVASADRLRGTPLAEIPDRVRADLIGPSTCTHLNSTLRCLADAAALLAVAEREGSPP